MTHRDKCLVLVLAGLMVIVGLPVAGKWWRHGAAPRCEFNGLPIQRIYQVRIVDGVGESHRFCCIRCARLWLEREAGGSATVLVTDEGSGREIDARTAYFVSSRVETSPITRNRIHAFGTRADALEHQRAFDGWELTGPDRPFPTESISTPEE